MSDQTMAGNGHAHDHPTEHGSPNGESRQVAIAEEAGGVPIAEAIEESEDFTPNPEDPGRIPGIPYPEELELGKLKFPPTLPPLKLCRINLAEGCYELSIKPNTAFVSYRGTLRVEQTRTGKIISGDLYRFLNIKFPLPIPATRFTAVRSGGAGDAGGAHAHLSVETAVSPAASASLGLISPITRQIPIYPRGNYYSYLKIVDIRQTPALSLGNCRITLTAEEYVYTQPPSGSFNGSFPSSPTRTVKLVLREAPSHPIFGSPAFEGTLYEGNVAKGQISMQRVSTRFRRATIEVDTVDGAVAPQAVPAAGGSGTEDIRTVFASAGWAVNVDYDQVNVPVPSGVTATDCWSSSDLHALMQSVRKPTTNLDAEWRLHLVVVPAEMGCGRGVMYDQIGVPREGVASFCDDGYPSNESSSFGTAANQRQRDVPRAFLRSACHELGHGFNQIHQEQEGGADNSIMTTTPSVANVLGGPPGVFPTDINLTFNAHVRHHLIHWPDPVVRPGGMTFGSGHSSTVPSADRLYFSTDELELKVSVAADRIELGEPLQLSWTLVNNSSMALAAPSDVRTEAQTAFIRVTNPQGVRRTIRSFEVRTDGVAITAMKPREERAAETRLYWSTEGFAFETPGRFTVEVEVLWAQDGVPLGVRTTTDVWVNYPSNADNEAAATLLHPEVGMYVALGGAAHLHEAVDRLTRVAGLQGDGDQPGAKALRGYAGILPIDLGDRAPVGAGSR